MKHRIKKLDSRGVAHFVLPLLVIVLIAVVGTYMVVASHADSFSGGAKPKTSKTTKVKKAKVSMSARSVQAYANSFKMVALLQTPRGPVITPKDCSGVAAYNIYFKGKQLYGVNPGGYAAWSPMGCTITITGPDLAYEDGSYSIRIAYYGNKHLQANARTFHYKVKTPEMP